MCLFFEVCLVEFLLLLLLGCFHLARMLEVLVGDATMNRGGVSFKFFYPVYHQRLVGAHLLGQQLDAFDRVLKAIPTTFD